MLLLTFEDLKLYLFFFTLKTQVSTDNFESILLDAQKGLGLIS